MAYEMKPNTGSLFRNDRKRDGKKDADYNGSFLIGGVEYWGDAWIYDNPGGGKRFSMSFREKTPKQNPDFGYKNPPQEVPFDDEIDF